MTQEDNGDQICWICNVKSVCYFIKFNKDGSATLIERCMNPNCRKYNKFIQYK